MRRRGLPAVVALAVVAAVLVLRPHGGAGTLTVVDATVPLPPPGATTVAVYATIRNGTDTDDRVLGVSTDLGPRASLMTEVTRGGASYMSEQPTVGLPARSTVRLVSGKGHVMVREPSRALVVGERVEVTFTFEHAGRRTVTAPVVAR